MIEAQCMINNRQSPVAIDNIQVTLMQVVQLKDDYPGGKK